MPLYEFLCDQCNSVREVLIDYDARKQLELLCVHCGGTMRPKVAFTFNANTSNLESKKDHNAHVDTSSVTKSCGHGQHCMCAVKISGQNPFQEQIDKALGRAEHD